MASWSPMRSTVIAITIFLAILLGFSNSGSAQFLESISQSNPLMGRTASAIPASIDAAAVNPAQVAAMRNSEAQLSWGFSSYEYLLRYPRFETHSESKSGLDAFPLPGVVWKPAPKWGINGLAIPIRVGKDIEARRLPIVLLGQEQYVDMVGTGALKGLVVVNVGYAFSPMLNFGLGLEYTGVEAGLAIKASNEGNQLTAFKIDTSNLIVKTGWVGRVARGITLGFSTGLLKLTTIKTVVDSSLSAPANPSDDDTDSQVTEVLNPIRVGASFQVLPKFLFAVDLEYERTNKNQSGFSTVDLKNKPRDVSDTLSVYTGMEFKMRPSLRLLGGFFYEPASVGPGSSDPNGKTGFGFLDLATALGEPPSQPQWMAGGGVRYFFGTWERLRNIGTDAEKKVIEPRMVIDAGFLYGETSIGVDQSGEQPGAYLVRRYKIPLRFAYRF